MSSTSEMYLLAVSGLFVCFGLSLVAVSLGSTRFLGMRMKGGWDRVMVAIWLSLASLNLVKPDISVGFRANPMWAVGIAAALGVAAFCIRIYRINKGEDNGKSEPM